MYDHVLQSPVWARFKNEYGTPAIVADNVIYTKHKIPFTYYYYAYCPRVNPFKINFENLRNSLKENSCIAIHFDVPNVAKGSKEEQESVDILEENCVISSRDEFAKGNFLLDLTISEKELMHNMHKKQRYNIRYSERKGVSVREGNTPDDFENFYNLYKETAERQKYYYRTHKYLYEMWETFNSENMAHILIAEYENKPLASWMLIYYKDALYYPYGGSSEELKNLQASCLVGWESIRLGKNLGAKIFDMWGASEDLDNDDDPYSGFSTFKSKFGGKHVTYIDSYDLVINTSMYKMFTTANTLRWKILRSLK